MRHCQRDFKRETPQEYESWRELYLRLHEEREERLRLLTQNISSAHANKPKGSVSSMNPFSQLSSRIKMNAWMLFWPRQGGKWRWRLWIPSQNRRGMSAVGRRSLAPLPVYPQLPLPWLHLPLSLYWCLICWCFQLWPVHLETFKILYIQNVALFLVDTAAKIKYIHLCS